MVSVSRPLFLFARHQALWGVVLLLSVVGCEGGGQGVESGTDRRPQWAQQSIADGVDRCGDGACGVTEACWSCAEDCGPCASGSCGDAQCQVDETCSSCPTDCGGCDAVCGDGTCSVGETCAGCERDCGICEPPVCGNGLCESPESCESCATDCGGCSECGDEVCDRNETCESCASDCGQCPNPCGDGTCAANENCTTCADDCGVCEPGGEVTAREREVLDLVNAARAAGAQCPSGPYPAVGPLTLDVNLATAARNHSLDMGTRGYFDHDTPEGVDPYARMAAAGYTGSPGAENIAAGNSTAVETMDQWMNSDGHCRNIMNGSLDELGVGYAYVEGSPYRHYWTQNFGRR